ncbi:hypothetical protein CORC01_01746 [Colletotrichum orchidophilum]|uniref:LysM domain-containing protein n=1 Tax=Colletotrichum orchidophilum TaxID=1209926 RepID=A0A1G4BNU5_9PEZI|nr:uncharacterized protein CORC01_01746 [Colletotrichum orchidophilum]OHF02988.1 hypothetical protein CORC01_01746 [Colletotrichum orchidophilum]
MHYSSTLKAFLLPALALIPYYAVADDCQPITWKRSAQGDITCRYETETSADISAASCAMYAAIYGIDTDTFLSLNPEIDSACSNIQPNTKYCVKGWIQATQASDDGLCGIAHGNHTCSDTVAPCCNIQTGRCSSSSEDCTTPICDLRFSTQCITDSAGSISSTEAVTSSSSSSCCNTKGLCGDGLDFCGTDVCASGNCTINIVEIPKMPGVTVVPWQKGNTPDGTCGGSGGYTCDVLFGNCCGAHGVCGSDEGACGQGW